MISCLMFVSIFAVDNDVFLCSFYRATAMLSVVYAVVVCLCVCVCHTSVLYQNG